MILLSDISKIFRDRGDELKAVNGVSLEIKKGEIFGIVGYSGAGKSTLVRCMNLLETPDSGSITLEGMGTVIFKDGKARFQDGSAEGPLTGKRLRSLRREMGMIFQHFNLLDRSTVFDNIAYPLRHAGLTRAEIEKRANELLRLVDLEDKKHAFPCSLSGGQKQRVAIARALAARPGILLSDEATSALDPEATASILKLLQDLNRELGLTVVLITHEMSVVKSVCDRVAVMEGGRIKECGSVYELFSSPREEISRKFVSSSSGLGRIDDIISAAPREGVLLKCVYGRDSVSEAVISQISRLFNVDVNIMLGSIEMLQGSPLGGLIVSMSGREHDRNAAIEYMRQKNIRVEVIERERMAAEDNAQRGVLQ